MALRDRIAPSSHIKAILLSAMHPMHSSKLYVIVEGLDDRKLYEAFFWRESVFVAEAKGVTTLLDVVRMLNQKSADRGSSIPKAIGIRDADFTHLEGRTEEVPCIFLTDYHDAEMTILACDHVWHRIYSELFDPSINRLLDGEFGNDPVKFRRQVLESLRVLSGLRWINDRDRIGLDFDGHPLGSYYSGKECQLDAEACLKMIHKRSSKDIPRNVSLGEIHHLVDPVEDLYNLSNGHDVLLALSLCVTSFRKHHGREDMSKRGMNYDDLASMCRLTYQMDDFRKTNLYRQIKSWGESLHIELFPRIPA